MKVIVLGTNHAGTTTVRTLKRLDPSCEVTTYDKNDAISFLGCGIALWVKGEVKDSNMLFYASPEILRSEGINVFMNHEVLSIDEKEKTVLVKDLKTGNIKKDNYDKLVMATGTWPIIPPIPGIDLEGVQIVKNYHHAKTILEHNLNKNYKKIAIVGAGYIGVELVEAFNEYGKDVTLIDVANRIMPLYYDKEFTDLMEEKMIKAGIKLELNSRVIEFRGQNGKVTQVITDKGAIDVDYVIFSVGVRPQSKIVENICELDATKAIVTNDYMQTTNPNIYAVGDCAQVYNKATGRRAPIQLATTAVRTGITAATNIIKGNILKSPGYTGANGISVFGLNMASVGISVEAAARFGIDVESINFKDLDRPEFMSTANEVSFKVVWDKKTRKILGAQVASEKNHTETMYMMALAIQRDLTIDELPLVDIFFLPHFNKPFNFICLAGLEVLGLNYFKKEDKK
ncbi:FAD-dependent oxidoreductase [Metamycoplasma auris]|uniref:NADPH-dependent 2,4-dienoyl-CoA reductase/sulfur reductase-like enzyme n=1 Tax=Metamycoplasma auris TaxID=51363 RepID=A0A2W7G5B3_9BACT|nr:FAD-dependent oxidoreductase [Metamycoplasma auris]PZW01457.1 NADPH-dependent 2,4-dienoyl-CoA reductase/sulfur reductase-like enzyme [Metamycoplasma auris]